MRQTEFLSVLAGADQPRKAEVPGFCLRKEYITALEETTLLAALENGPWETDWQRRIQQYGVGYAGRDGARPRWVRDFPEWLNGLATRVCADAGFERFPENCVINEYISPRGIAPHTDYPAFGPKVACVSLGSDVVMDLMSPDQSHVVVDVPAQPVGAQRRGTRLLAARDCS